MWDNNDYTRQTQFAQNKVGFTRVFISLFCKCDGCKFSHSIITHIFSFCEWSYFWALLTSSAFQCQNQYSNAFKQRVAEIHTTKASITILAVTLPAAICNLIGKIPYIKGTQITQSLTTEHRHHYLTTSRFINLIQYQQFISKDCHSTICITEEILLYHRYKTTTQAQQLFSDTDLNSETENTRRRHTLHQHSCSKHQHTK